MSQDLHPGSSLLNSPRATVKRSQVKADAVAAGARHRAAPAQHPEVGTSLGTSAPSTNEHHGRQGFKGGASLEAACCSGQRSAQR